ncbi:BnaC06g26340D [Brassica napus]|uniref:BnaC06g26340D protein n=1 Tax=Brassica napus TaxID=3708 RepID=A0A078GTM2_BRANA|nr:BnaC06g26340D [Brassica napus]
MIRNHCYFFCGIVTIYFSLLIRALASPTLHFNCRNDQRDALLEFRDEFPPTDDSNLSSWNKSSDCCLWNGVTCNDKSGQVISVDLHDTSLNSSLKTNSSLFRLHYLRHLNLAGCDLRGEIPGLIGNLNRLRYLSLEYNYLIGVIPISIGNLSRLTNLELFANDLEGEIPTSIGNLNELRVMSLDHNSLGGNIPIWFTNLTKLSQFSLRSNNFTSTLPLDMSGFHNLELFDVAYNSFLGPFPKSLFSLPLLQSVDLGVNQFMGPIEFVNTSSSKLQFLSLHQNRFDGPIPESISKFLNLRRLYFSQNNFTGPVPKSMSKLVDLNDLQLSNNKLEGEVPGFLWRMNTMMISHNSFSSFEKFSREPSIQMLDLSSNSFRGPFPNWICKLKWLSVLDLSNNLFNGSIPTCLRNSIVYLLDLSLRNNSFSGVLPDIFDGATSLRLFDVGQNQLEGKFPKSLIHCKSLQLVNVGGNKIKDTFPSWLGSLPSLNVLSLRSNKFYGRLCHPHVSIGFQSLRVVDVSHNDFTGTLPPHYFSSWREMTMLNQGTDYMVNFMKGSRYMLLFPESIFRSMEMVIKGVETNFERIRQDFRAIDFSGNKIYGKIPESIGFLKELRLLNLSGNAFTSDIPRSLANLTDLEALDLSSNKLSGQIPQDFSKLSFLSYVNFSHNLLQGPVPRSTQFQRQKYSSFLDNPGLYGLEEICGERHVPSPTSQQAVKYSEAKERMINWVAAAIAYGPGILCGLVIGHIFTSHNQEWFPKNLG